jgi:hypothetical protein
VNQALALKKCTLKYLSREVRQYKETLAWAKLTLVKRMTMKRMKTLKMEIASKTTTLMIMQKTQKRMMIQRLLKLMERIRVLLEMINKLRASRINKVLAV